MSNKTSSSKILTWTLTVALAGFLFGFDTAVISGADQPIQELWKLSDWSHGIFIMSMALWGTVLGALGGGIPVDKFGRKKTLFWIGVLYAVSALGSALAWDPVSFSIFRFIGGVGVGASSVAVPTYISEIAPAEKRGRLVASYQFMLVFGILVAFASNAIIGSLGSAVNWRLMLGIEAIPAIIYTIMVLTVPESPRWLILQKNDTQTAGEILGAIDSQRPVSQQIAEIKNAALEGTQRAKNVLFTKKYTKPILLAFLLAMFNQLSGINFVLYYAPRLFEIAGLDTSSALTSSIGIGITNLIFTMAGLALIDKLGRKTLLIIGSIGYILTLAAISWAFNTSAGGSLVALLVFGFVASHAVGQGAIIWVFISEIFPNSVRANGQALGSGTHWVFAAIITLVTPSIISAFSPGPIFAFFAVMMGVQLLFALFYLPETKGVPLEEIQAKLMG